MTVQHLEVLVEEPSMEAALAVLLPKMVPGVEVAIHAHQGKADLLAKLPTKLRAYAAWITSTYRILVIVDRDSDDYDGLKQQLEAHAASAGLATPSTAGGRRCVVINRIAIEELEAWYFGDWEAVCAAYPKAPPTVPRKSAFRDPDQIKGGTWEQFERVLQGAGYFAGGLRKREAARAIARHMIPSRNTSCSFRSLRVALEQLVD